MSRRKKNIGDWGEEQAGRFLERQGFKIVERNYHAVAGEIDIVAVKNGDYYFIEVKTRLDKELANDSAVTPRKKYKFLKTVKKYCYVRGVSGEVGLIPAGLIVAVDRAKKSVGFRLAVWSG